MNSLPQFNSNVYYLGRLCKRHHAWHNTGRSLRQKSNRSCIECKRECDADYNHARAKAGFAKRIGIVNTIKMERGCADCGYKTHPAALHFDHLPGTQKRRGIAQMCSQNRIDKLLAEIAKCEVVCANCHAVRTAERRLPRL